MHIFDMTSRFWKSIKLPTSEKDAKIIIFFYEDANI